MFGGLQSPASHTPSRAFLGDVTNTPSTLKAARNGRTPASLTTRSVDVDYGTPVRSGLRIGLECNGAPPRHELPEPLQLPAAMTTVAVMQSTLVSPSVRPTKVAGAAVGSPSMRAKPCATGTPHYALNGSRTSSFVGLPSHSSSRCDLVRPTSPARASVNSDNNEDNDDVELGLITGCGAFADHLSDVGIPMLLDDLPAVPPMPPLAASFRSLMTQFPFDAALYDVQPPRDTVET